MARVVVIGGDAGGMSAAAQLRRTLVATDEVVVFERGEFTSYSACGIPYWVAGEVDERDDLVARSPEEHRAHGIDLRTGTEVTAIDVQARTVTTADGASTDYDALLIATGAEPVRPDLPGIDGAGVLGVQSLTDGQAVIDALGETPRHVVVVGSGYIGLEMAEAFTIRGVPTTVVERGATPLGIIEAPLGEQVAEAMRGRGISLRTGAAVTGFEIDDRGHVRAVLLGAEGAEPERLPADLVVLGLGVRARTDLARAAGLPLGVKDGLVTDEFQRVVDGVWAAGDCVQTHHLVSGQPVHLALGTHANKQGQVAAAAIAAHLRGEAPVRRFPGAVGTAITGFCSLEISRTGLGEREAREAGFDPVVATISTSARAGYMPDPGAMTVLLVADRASRRVLGVQIVGSRGSGLRVDAAAVAITAAMTVDDLVALDLAYAPPFSSVWSPIQVAARAAVSALARS